MTTTIDIPDDDVLTRVKRRAGTDSTRDAVLFALREAAGPAVPEPMDEAERKRRLAEVANLLGTFESLVSDEEFERMRTEE